jgi:hypothetical protein
MANTGGRMRRDPLSIGYDRWARGLLAVLKADPWNWHGRTVVSDEPGPLDNAGLTHPERAAQRSLWYCLGHAQSTGLKIRPDWSLQVAWGAPAYPGQPWRRRMITARVTPRAAGRRSVLIRGRASYIATPTSRGLVGAEHDWQPGRPR